MLNDIVDDIAREKSAVFQITTPAHMLHGGYQGYQLSKAMGKGTLHNIGSAVAGGYGSVVGSLIGHVLGSGLGLVAGGAISHPVGQLGFIAGSLGGNLAGGLAPALAMRHMRKNLLNIAESSKLSQEATAATKAAIHGQKHSLGNAAEVIKATSKTILNPTQPPTF